MEGGGDRLTARIAELDEVVAELGDSPDPVARRQLATALITKANTLRELGRLEDSAAVWREVSVTFAQDPPSSMPLVAWHAMFNQALSLLEAGHPAAVVDVLDRLIAEASSRGPELDAVVVQSLDVKSRALRRQGQGDAAADADAELVRRFAGASQPEARVRVAYAQLRLAAALLGARRVGEAVVLSEQLIAAVEDERDPAAQLTLGDVLLTHVRALLSSAPFGLGPVALDAAVILTAAPREIATGLSSRLRIPVGPSRALERAASAVGSVAPRTIVDRRVRAETAARASRVLVHRFAGTDEVEAQRIAATARLCGAVAQFKLGHLRAVPDAFAILRDSDEPGVVAAFTRLADQARLQGGAVGETGAMAFLFQRAQALAQGDRRIAAIAYRDSLTDHAVQDPRTPAGRLVKWILGAGRHD